MDRNLEDIQKVEENEDVLAFEGPWASGEQTVEEQSVLAAKKASAAGAKRCRELGSAAANHDRAAAAVVAHD